MFCLYFPCVVVVVAAVDVAAVAAAAEDLRLQIVDSQMKTNVDEPTWRMILVEAFVESKSLQP